MPPKKNQTKPAASNKKAKKEQQQQQVTAKKKTNITTAAAVNKKTTAKPASAPTKKRLPDDELLPHFPIEKNVNVPPGFRYDVAACHTSGRGQGWLDKDPNAPNVPPKTPMLLAIFRHDRYRPAKVELPESLLGYPILHTIGGKCRSVGTVISENLEEGSMYVYGETACSRMVALKHRGPDILGIAIWKQPR